MVLQLTEKPRSVGPHKSKLKKTTNKKKARPQNKKFRSVSTQQRRGSVDPSSAEENILQQRLIYTNKEVKNYSFIDTGASIPIVAWKLTKNHSHIISDVSIPGCSSHSGNSQRFKLDADSPSVSELLYYIIGSLLFTRKITISDIKACVTYIFTMMELTTNYHKGRHLNIDIFL